MDYGLFCLNNRVPADGMAAPEEGFMKKIVIAGNSGSTENYAEALTRLGASCTVTTDCRFAGDFDALLLPGGGDIDPVLFGESDHGSRKIEPGLDRKQLAMLDAFVRLSRPVLGICKGMQIINVYFGGGVIQDLPTNYAHQYDGRDQVHPSHAVPGSIFHQLYGADFNVNSAHHQGIGSPGRGLSVVLLTEVFSCHIFFRSPFRDYLVPALDSKIISCKFRVSIRLPGINIFKSIIYVFPAPVLVGKSQGQPLGHLLGRICFSG